MEFLKNKIQDACQERSFLLLTSAYRFVCMRQFIIRHFHANRNIILLNLTKKNPVQVGLLQNFLYVNVAIRKSFNVAAKQPILKI